MKEARKESEFNNPAYFLQIKIILIFEDCAIPVGSRIINCLEVNDFDGNRVVKLRYV